MVRLLIIAVLLAGCGEVETKSKPVDLVLPGNVAVSYGASPHMDSDVTIAFDELRAYADGLCGGSRALNLRIDFVPSSTVCGNNTVGCYVFEEKRVEVKWFANVYDSGLAHEAMHHIWQLCTGSNGTTAGEHDHVFLRDEQVLNERIRAVLDSRT